MNDGIVAAVKEKADEVAALHGLEVVEIVLRRQGKYSLLRVDVDRAGPGGVGLGDCERVSRDLEAWLDRQDPIAGTYELQVSSPGLDRPIRTDDDVRRNTGRRIVVETSVEIGGSTRLRGTLLGLDGASIRLGLPEGGEATIPREHVVSAVQDPDADLRAPAPRRRSVRPKAGARGIVR